VLARVVQDPDTGEGIGCVTVSVEDNQVPELQLTRDYYSRELAALAKTVALMVADK
jgi:hypothetical protein